MRFRSGILFLLSGLLGACEPALEPGPRVDFVSSSRFNASTRRITTPGDTVAVKVYAEAQDSTSSPLTRLVIKATYTPEARPFIYGPLYDEGKATSFELTYLDTVFSRGGFAFQSTLAARTTAGRENWSYEVSDSESRTGARSFYLRLGRSDSASLEVHNYSITLQAPGVYDRRSFLALREGFALPKFTVRTLAANQALIDLVYVSDVATGAPTLATTTDAPLKLNWASPRRTQIRRTSLNAAQFGAATSASALTAAFTSGNEFTPRATSTGPLAKEQVLAFQTPDNISGLILIQDIITTTRIRTLVLQVRVTK